MVNLDETSTIVTGHLPQVGDGESENCASLVVLHGSRMGQTYRLNQPTLVIGRSTECDIQIDDENVSRRHAAIACESDKVLIRDLGSTNGTFVNARRVKEAALEDGDLLIISTAVLKFVSSSSIENHFFDQMYSMITTDFQTKLNNHRYFMSRLHEEFSRARRHERPLAVLVYDIDNFKRINDSFGHQAGDQLLARSAKLISSQLREDDVFARFGGDEFCILCPETAREQALILAERLRALMAKARFTYRDWKLDVTISIGAAELDQETESPEQLLRQADQALYRAKEEGRNRICG